MGLSRSASSTRNVTAIRTRTYIITATTTAAIIYLSYIHIRVISVKQINHYCNKTVRTNREYGVNTNREYSDNTNMEYGDNTNREYGVNTNREYGGNTNREYGDNTNRE